MSHSYFIADIGTMTKREFVLLAQSKNGKLVRYGSQSFKSEVDARRNAAVCEVVLSN